MPIPVQLLIVWPLLSPRLRLTNETICFNAASLSPAEARASAPSIVSPKSAKPGNDS